MFSQTTEYAMRAMTWLSLSPGVLVPTTALAERTRVPVHYLAKVLQQLAAAKLITGRRGVRGGYRLARPPESITLLEVVSAVAPIGRPGPCVGDAGVCPMHRVVSNAVDAVVAILDGKSLADLLRDAGSETPLCSVEPARVLAEQDGALAGVGTA